MSKEDIELEETARQMTVQERAIFEMVRRQTGCEIGERISLKQRSPDLLLKCWRLMLSERIESPQRLFIHWQMDHKSGKPVLGWEVTKKNDQ